MAAGKARAKIGLRLVVVTVIFWIVGTTLALDNIDDELDLKDDTVSDPVVDSAPEFEYLSPIPTGLVYFAENFDDPDLAQKKWFKSKAHKEEDNDVHKYDGEWEYELPNQIIFDKDRALVLKSKAKHAAISAKLDKKFDFNLKPLFVQYEVTFQNGMDCGGGYIKLLSDSPKLDLQHFHDKTPYTIMFGPDKCGSDVKLHFIFRHKNPLNGTLEEKHAKKPSTRLEENYSDKKPHTYLLKLFPDNTFNIFVDGALINSGSLLKDMNPPVNPPEEIEDVNDKKPADWDERENIPDSNAKKPDDWDENEPAKIPDPNSVMPDGWLQDQKPMIPDETAVKPEDWDNEMDGEWEPPLITNPICEGAPGCGAWVPKQIDNPKYKGKWHAPMIKNPNYKGKWSPKLIRNPDYFEDKEPFKMTSIGAVGIEIWAMTNGVLFDNFIITDDEDVLADWTSATFDLKRKVIDKDAEGMFTRIINYSNAHPWIWAVYVVVIGLPIVLIVTFCCGDSKEAKSAAQRKKTDDFAPDDETNETYPPGAKDEASSRKEELAERDGVESDEGQDSSSQDSDDEPDGAGSKNDSAADDGQQEAEVENPRKRRIKANRD